MHGGLLSPVARGRPTILARLAAALAAMLACAPGWADADPCERHSARYGSHPLSVGGALALHARDATPDDTDMQCLERLWTPKDGAIAATATRALLMVASKHPTVAIQAAAKRPQIYRVWLADLGRYGLHDVNGEGRLLRSSITQLLATKPATEAQEQARKLLLDGLGAVQPFQF
jgi:hypothetical protein